MVDVDTEVMAYKIENTKLKKSLKKQRSIIVAEIKDDLFKNKDLYCQGKCGVCGEDKRIVEGILNKYLEKHAEDPIKV